MSLNSDSVLLSDEEVASETTSSLTRIPHKFNIHESTNLHFHDLTGLFLIEFLVLLSLAVHPIPCFVLAASQTSLWVSRQKPIALRASASSSVIWRLGYLHKSIAAPEQRSFGYLRRLRGTQQSPHSSSKAFKLVTYYVMQHPAHSRQIRSCQDVWRAYRKVGKKRTMSAQQHFILCFDNNAKS